MLEPIFRILRMFMTMEVEVLKDVRFYVHLLNERNQHGQVYHARIQIRWSAYEIFDLNPKLSFAHVSRWNLLSAWHNLGRYVQRYPLLPR